MNDAPNHEPAAEPASVKVEECLEPYIDASGNPAVVTVRWMLPPLPERGDPLPEGMKWADELNQQIDEAERTMGRHCNRPADFRWLQKMYAMLHAAGIDPASFGLEPTPQKQGLTELAEILFPDAKREELYRRASDTDQMWRIIAARCFGGQPPPTAPAPAQPGNPAPAQPGNPTPATPAATPPAQPATAEPIEQGPPPTTPATAAPVAEPDKPTLATPAADPQPDRPTRRGRLRKDESQAKQAAMLAILRKHPSLKDDISELARRVGMPERTVRRWIEKEEKAYLESAACQPPEPPEEE